ncbi:hypothetical protein [Bacillus phage YungSlug]|nr:hypothetical protein [Bacillus phage YungSlug]
MDEGKKYIPGLGTNFKISKDEVEATTIKNQADSTATDVAGLKADFNALLKRFRDAGFMK